ncbi:MAG: metallophosphoesterase family protein [Bacteroidales bacterium]
MRVALITDIHEQVQSLQQALALAARQRCDEVACLGDIIGFDPHLYPGEPARNAGECIRLIRENCRWVVAGNHDRQARTDNPELDPADLAWLDTLPDSIIIEPDGQRVLLSHYIYPDVVGSSMVFIRRQSQLSAFYGLLMRDNISLAFAGHDHPAGVGFAYPGPDRWISRYRRAIHYMPFSRYQLDGDRILCLLPALATKTSRPGISIWDTDDHSLDIIELNHLKENRL